MNNLLGNNLPPCNKTDLVLINESRKHILKAVSNTLGNNLIQNITKTDGEKLENEFRIFNLDQDQQGFINIAIN